MSELHVFWNDCIYYIFFVFFKHKGMSPFSCPIIYAIIQQLVKFTLRYLLFLVIVQWTGCYHQIRIKFTGQNMLSPGLKNTAGLRSIHPEENQWRASWVWSQMNWYSGTEACVRATSMWSTTTHTQPVLLLLLKQLPRFSTDAIFLLSSYKLGTKYPGTLLLSVAQFLLSQGITVVRI